MSNIARIRLEEASFIELMSVNPVSKKQRLTELLVDWILICLYLITLFLVMLVINYVAFGKALPDHGELYSQLIATFTTTIPVSIIFAWLDFRWQGSLGKHFAGLRLVFKRPTFGKSLLRNFLKFLPWQLGHVSVIRFMYGKTDFLTIILYLLSIGLLVTYLVMGLGRQDKRHLPDFLASSQVVQVEALEDKAH